MTDVTDSGVPANLIQHNVSPRSFARNVVFGYLATLTSMISGFVVTPVLYRNLGVDAYATFGLIMGLTGFALLADLGVGTSTVRRVARAVAQHDDRALWSTIRASRLLMIASGMLSLGVLLVVAWRIQQFFGLPADRVHDARLALVIASIGVSVSIALSTPTMVIIGHGRSDLLSKRTLALGLLIAVAQSIVAVTGGGVVGVCAVTAVGSVLTPIIGLLMMRRVIARERTDIGPAAGEVRDVLSEGLTNFVISVAGTVAFTSDTIILGAIAPLSAIAAYTIAAKLPGLIRLLTSRAIDLLQPTYSHLHATSDGDPGRRAFVVLSRATRFSSGAAIAIGIGACCSAGWLLHVWVGHTPAKTELTLVLLTAGTVLQMFGHAVYVFLTGVRKLRRLFVFSIVSALVNVALSIVLTMHLGAPGPALASLICVSIGDVVVLPAMTASALGVAPMRMLRELMATPLLPALPAVGLALALRVPSNSPWALLVGAASALVYLLGFWLLLGVDDRGYLRELGRGARTRFASA